MKLTAKGRDLMYRIGARQTSFFDEGIEEGSGIWGQILAEETGHGSGVLNRLEEQGLLISTVVEKDGGPSAGSWWELTAEGARVAKKLAERGETVLDLTPFRDRDGVRPIEKQRRSNLKALTTQLYRNDRDQLTTAVQACIADLEALAEELELDLGRDII